MPFTVVWLPAAQDALAEIWVQAADRQAVADADRIDRALGRAKDGYRVYADPPLAVGFEVSPDDCMVRVVRVASV
jgi:plasmid stabilization system protein ParE